MNLEQLKYGLYARKSNESEDKQIASLDDQLETMTEIAEAREYRIVKKAIYKESKSAKIPDQRIKFDELIEQIEKGNINAILTYKSNRLARNPKESGVIQQLMFDGKLKAIITKDKNYLPEDNALIFSIDAAQDTQFSRDLSIIVKDRMSQRAKNGYYPGRVPIGYKNAKESEFSDVNVIVIDDARYALVRRMWDYALTGQYSVSQIARIADKEWGLKTPKRKKTGNKPLSVSGLYLMFKNPFYMGAIRFSGIYHTEGKHSPMITPEEFRQVQGMIGRANQPRPEEKIALDDPFPYRGLVKCGECGCLITYSKIVKKQKNGNVHTYEYCYCTRKKKYSECSQTMTVSRITPQDLTKAIRNEISKYTIIEDFFKWTCEYLDEFHEDEAEKQEKVIETQMKAIKNTEAEVNKLQRALYKGMIDETFYKSEKQELEDRLITLRGQFDDQENSNKRQRQLLEKYFNFARYAKYDFESDNDLKKKEVLSIIGQNLLLKDGVLLFEPIEYLTPLVEKYPSLEKQFLKVQTYPEQMKKDAIASLIQVWYTRQDSNLWPSAPQADALSS